MGFERRWMRWVVLLGLMLGCGDGGGQTLARKNWEGSGLTAQAWWSRGVFCAAGADSKKVVGEMDVLEKLGCDAVEVDAGSAVEMDALVEAAGRGRMRVVADLDGSSGEQEVRGRVAFWGARGVAGFAVRGAADGVVGRLRQAVPGRLVIGDGGQLGVRQVPDLDAAELRAWLTGLGAGRQGILLEDGTARLGDARAAMLLASGGAARVAVDAVLPGIMKEDRREFSAEDLLLWVPEVRKADGGEVDWVRGLSELHHGNASLRMGQVSFLDLDAFGVLGWVVAGRDGRSGVLVVCNLSGKAVRVPVAAVVRAAGVRGTSLKMLVRSDGLAAGGDSLEGVGLGVDGVFVGEVRWGRGAEFGA